MMSHLRNSAALALALALAGGLALPALAQDAASPAPAAETTTETAPAAPAADAATDTAAGTPAIGEPSDGIGEPYVAGTHGDWELRCIHSPDGTDPCQLYQLLKDNEGNAVAEISLLSLPEGQNQNAIAGATIITPLETLLTQQLNITVDKGQTKRYPFTFCAEIGCVARVGFTAAEIAGFKKGATATITVVPVADPSRTVDINLSLKGFTAGFEAVKKANLANQPAAKP